MPSYSIGFSVASRRNGDGSSRVIPSTVTWYSAIASRSADCVFGVARLISSTRITFAKIGPGRNTKSLVFWSKIERPGDVGRLQVGRALDAVRGRALDAPRDRAGEHGLRRARDVLEQDVAAAHEGGQDELDLVPFAVDDGLDVVEEDPRDLGRSRDELMGSFGVGDDRLHRRDGIYARVADRDRHRVREQPLSYFYAVGPSLLVIREGDALAVGRFEIRAGDLS